MSHQQITLQAHILQAIVLTSIGRNKQMLPQANFLQANVYKLMSTSKVDKQMWNKQISCHPLHRGVRRIQTLSRSDSQKKQPYFHHIWAAFFIFYIQANVS